MVKLTILIVFAFMVCASAIPIASTEDIVARGEPFFDTAANGELVTPCLCGNTTGLWCGERSSTKYKHNTISGNCNTTSLYFCSQWAVNTSGIADLVQDPCWTGKCYQLPYNTTGIDSCNSDKPKREELAPEATQAVTEPEKSSSLCICGKSTGNYCGERSSGNDTDKPMTGDCKANSLYYCSPWAVNTTAFADVAQGPCWTNECFQSTQLGYDSCTPPRAPASVKGFSSHLRPEYAHMPVAAQPHSYHVPRKELDLQPGAKKDEPKLNPMPDPNCKCGSDYGWYCGKRIVVTEFKNDSKSLSGKCKPDTMYFCDDDEAATGGPALIFDEDQGSSGAQCVITEHGLDYCESPKGNPVMRQEDEKAVDEHRSAPETTHDHAAPREEFTPEVASNPLPAPAAHKLDISSGRG